MTGDPLRIEVQTPSGQLHTLWAPDGAVVGKSAQAEVRLDGWRVGNHHARLFRTPAGLQVEDLGAFGGVWVNGQRAPVLYGPVQPDDLIGIGSYKLRVAWVPERAVSVPDAVHPLVEVPSVVVPAVPAGGQAPGHAAEPAAEGLGGPAAAATPPLLQWRQRLHARLIDAMDLRRQDVSAMSDAELRQATEALITQLMADMAAELPVGLDRGLLRQQVLDEAVGLGPLEDLLADDTVSEIMVNRHDEVFVERHGRLQPHTLTFTDDRAVLGVIERIVSPLGRRIDESSPMVDARLKDGSRVHAIIPPLALKGPCLTIRKFGRRTLSMADLVRGGALSPAMARFLEVCVQHRRNIIVAGGTGSGKTTLLNALSNHIPAGERIVTVEDAAELRLQHSHLVSLESRPPNLEGKGAITIRDLVRNTLRMRPDRIVVGECRGPEALDMLQAMNTGHEGSLTTLHANTPRDALSRLETMVLMAGMELPLAAIREQIASAVDIVVQQSRYACGSRVVTSITEVTGIESGKVQLQELFRFQVSGPVAAGAKVSGRHMGCDTVPSFYESQGAAGSPLDITLFQGAA